jgi:mannitol 2-dehydrogenase
MNYPAAGGGKDAMDPILSNDTMPEGILLSNKTVARLPDKVLVPRYDRGRISAGIVHIGVGNFHRAHEALYVDRCLHLPGHEGWGIIGVGLGAGEQKIQKARTIKLQDGLYTLTEYSPAQGVQARVIGSLIDYLHAPSQTEAVLSHLAHQDTRIVSLTITEGGYNIDKSTGEFVISDPAVQWDLSNPQQSCTAFGLIVEALAQRRAAGLGGFTVLSCDNLRSNGTIAHKAIKSFAMARDRDLAAWIESAVSFPNSMVDRIVPTVGAEEKRRANAFTGIEDAIPVIAESFTQWVVQDNFVAGRPAFDEVGIELRDDVESFEAIKGRLLNASHMMLSYPALMCGFRLVDEALREPMIAEYLDAFMEKDIIPMLDGPDGVSLVAYKRQTLERFANSAIGDQLLRIAQNGVAKLPIFLSKNLTQLLKWGGGFERVAFCLASFERYLSGQGFNGLTFLVDEPHLIEHDRALLKSNDALAVLKLSPFEALGLFSNEAFVKVFLAARNRLRDEGPIASLAFAAHAPGPR